MPSRADYVVVGGGLIGLATAVEILERRSGASVAVLEKETAIARHQSGRNSCVIHSGVYYPPGSLKARLCREGRRLLLEFCEQRGISYELCGKVIVATDENERHLLDRLLERGRANGVALRAVGPDELAEIEPACRAVAALAVADAGLVDYSVVAAELAARVRELGGVVVTGAEVVAIDGSSRSVVLATQRGSVEASYAVACAGLQSDRLVAADGTQAVDQAIVPFKGSYFALLPHARELCRTLIYPVPDPRFPFLGVHVSRRPGGEVWAGPNAVLALGREAYGIRDTDLREVARVLGLPGFRRLARTYWRTGLAEVLRDLSKRAVARQIQRYLPELAARDLVRTQAGIRAQAVSTDGQLVDDFVFVARPRMLHVANAPSPGATACLAIGREIAGRTLALPDDGDAAARARPGGGR